ncbi:unnamed protein product [Arabidopsis halleri]
MDRSSYYHSSSALNSPASETSSPMPLDSPMFDVQRFHLWTGRSQPEVGFPLMTVTSSSVEPIYPGIESQLTGMGQIFSRQAEISSLEK